MYPSVFKDYAVHLKKFGRVSQLPTIVFFYGMEPGEEIAVEIETGKTLIIRFLTQGEADNNGFCSVFFELNGQPRSVRILDESFRPSEQKNLKAEDGNPNHIGAPMPGVVSNIAIKEGQKIKRGDTILSIEAMKMETSIIADKNATISELQVNVGTTVSANDLLVVVKD